MTKWNVREPMSNDEKRMLEANKYLLEKNKELERDVRILISYIKGRKYLENEVKEIISYYSQKKKETDE